MSRSKESQYILADPIHETKDFAVILGELKMGEDWKGRDGYLILNKRTNVVEGELTVEWAAIKTIRDLQTQLEAALENKPFESDMSFDDMIQTLAARQSEGETPEQ